MSTSERITALGTFMRKHERALAIALVVIAVASSITGWEYLTSPAMQIPSGNIPPVPKYVVDLMGVSALYNQTLYPQEFNESGKSFNAAFQVMQYLPNILTQGGALTVGFVITVPDSTVSSPYSSVQFIVANANFSVGRYVMNSYALSYINYGVSPTVVTISVAFNMAYYALTNVEPANRSYPAYYNVTILPVLYFGPFHFTETPLTIRSGTMRPWFYIEHERVE